VIPRTGDTQLRESADASIFPARWCLNIDRILNTLAVILA